MKLIRKHTGYAGGALAIVSGVAGVISWWLPSSAKWLNHHGFAAWPVAALFAIMFTWATVNWYQSDHELARTRASISKPLPEDRRLFEHFKTTLPKDAAVLIWLRNRSEDRTYRWRDVMPLHKFAEDWCDADQHFINADLERAAVMLCESAFEFRNFQSRHAERDPRSDDDDPAYRVYGFTYDAEQDAIRRGLGKRADDVLAAHNELYVTGSRLGF
jgi:hypothetical protein